MELLLASNNDHKRLEISALLPEHSLITPAQRQIVFEFEENGDSFIANALGKAQELYSLANAPVLADDSGLIVDALNGGPGVYSARYGSHGEGLLSSIERNSLLLSHLETIPMEKRTARFVCAMALIVSPFRKFVVQETVEGYIATEPHGEGGFGYDPIFIVEQGALTMAQLSPLEKNKISHRARAAQQIAVLLREIEKKEIFYVC
ncbi:MAG: RdgB/HAM1 family non-canonical purine NTP pyrophosphatase [Sphaerochaetaceae bacterium]